MKNTGKKKSAFKEKISKRLKSQKDLARIREYEQATEKSRTFQERKKAEKIAKQSATLKRLQSVCGLSCMKLSCVRLVRLHKKLEFEREFTRLIKER
jgi:hypothetical protein